MLMDELQFQFELIRSRDSSQAQVSDPNSLSQAPASFSLTNLADVAFSIAAIAGSNQSTIVNQAFNSSLQAQVSDQFGNPISNSIVTFSVPGAGASAVGSGTATTNALGIATINLSANTIAGTFSAAGSTSGVATSANFALTNLPDAPFDIAPIAGSNQSTIVNQAFSPLQVRVTDQFGNPISNSTVTFDVPEMGASAVGSGAVTTDSSGIATINLSANTIAGTFSVVSNAGAATPANFDLTNLPDVPFSITSTGTLEQTTRVNTLFKNPLQAVVTDQFGNPISNSTVTFSVPTIGASGRFTGEVTTIKANTDATGTATVTIAANTIAGNYTGNASVNGVSTTANYTLYNNTGNAAQIAGTGGTLQQTDRQHAFQQCATSDRAR